MRIAGKKHRAIMPFKGYPLAGVIRKKNNILCFVIGRLGNGALLKRKEPDNVFACQAILHINVAPVSLEPGPVAPFSRAGTDKSKNCVTINLMPTVGQNREI
jgi:hypothetical protein